uniref:Surface protein n=1 Tax=Syphacia muris TaxID=451379 RepID=A0A0N5AXB1_9BILA
LFKGDDNDDEAVVSPSERSDKTELRELCAKVAEIVKRYCIPGSTNEFLMPRCKAYFEDCGKYVSVTDPLYAIANSFTSGVEINFGNVRIDGIPYYPINQEGTIEIGSNANIPFGSWGGGYRGNFGVRDFWSQFSEFEGNWYEGKYDARSGWSAPIVQSLGVEGNAGVKVPIKKEDFGKPVAVDIGGNVGPYYQQTNHIDVDWLNGGVKQNFVVGVPLIGLGINSGWGLNFPKF